MSILIEQTENEVLYAGGINTQKPMTISGTAGLTVSGTSGVALTGTANLDLSGTSGTIKVPSIFPNGLFSVAIQTNGTTAVNVFGSTAGFAGCLTSIQIDSIDNANGTIDVFSDAGSIMSIAKGSIGAIKSSAFNTTATTFASASTMKIVSGNGAGNAIVVATFRTA